MWLIVVSELMAVDLSRSAQIENLFIEFALLTGTCSVILDLDNLILDLVWISTCDFFLLLVRSCGSHVVVWSAVAGREVGVYVVVVEGRSRSRSEALFTCAKRDSRSSKKSIKFRI